MPVHRKSKFAACLLFSIFYGSMATAQQAPRIVGGTAVTDDKYPFMAAIYAKTNGEVDFYPICAGTVVGSRWIMTAAHCVVNKVAALARSSQATTLSLITPRGSALSLLS